MTLVKAVLVNLDAKEGDDNQKFACMFNPNEYSVTVSNDWKGDISPALRVPQITFRGANSGTLDLTLFFDVFEQAGESVLKYTNKLLKLTEIQESTRDAATKQGRPPRCRLQWGDMYSFTSFITKITLKFTLFREDGTPVRATAGVTLVEAHEQETVPPPSNPEQVSRVYTIKTDDTLSSIAAQEYKDPTAWRVIAMANDIEDVVNLEVGKELKIPELSWGILKD